MLGTNIGIDLGTTSILIFVEGKGIVVSEPSTVAFDTDTGRLLAVGQKAADMIGRNPDSITVVKLMRSGVISDFTATKAIVRVLLYKVCKNMVFKPNIVVCMPSTVTNLEKRTILDLVTAAGAGRACLIEEPLAAALGAGLDIRRPMGTMVVDIGGGTADIAVVTMGSISISKSVKIAGNILDEDIIRYLRRERNIVIGEKTAESNPEDEFKIADLGKILSSRSFWVVALLCVLYYSAIFPFQRYGANMLQCNLNGIAPEAASNIFRWFPIGAAIITPFLGAFLDKKGKGATMLIYGAFLLIICHLVFAFALPATGSKLLAYATIVLLGISFALVPAALWPSVPKIIDEKILGSAYCLIFWVQNIGLCFVPKLIGSVLESSNATNAAVIAAKQAGAALIPYNYTTPLIIFAGFGVLALIVALYFKALDRKEHLGLEEPNIK